MAWWGKLLGGTFGFMLGGPLGALLGGALGHQYDKGLENRLSQQGIEDEAGPEEREIIQTAFFTATFSVMGYIAKADGVVTRDEIRFAEAVMAQMDLTGEQRQVARKLFGEGKKADFKVDEVLEQFRQQVGRRRNLLRMFLEIQIQAAYGDGTMHKAEETALRSISRRLGISAAEFKAIEYMVRAASAYTQQQQGYRSGGQRWTEQPRRPSAGDAYKVLGVEASASDAEVKKAYRRLISRHHPDKLASSGLPEEMMKMAAEKTHEIKQAYDTIKESRGMR